MSYLIGTFMPAVAQKINYLVVVGKRSGVLLAVSNIKKKWRFRNCREIIFRVWH